MKTIALISLWLACTVAAAANIKVILPPGANFTVQGGGPQAWLIDSPYCRTYTIDIGQLGNVRLTCVPAIPDALPDAPGVITIDAPVQRATPRPMT